MTRIDLSSRVVTLLNRKSGCVILIKGGWGTGKTYFWINSIEPSLNSETTKQRKTAYVSLFGKNNIESIQSDVLMQLFTINKHVKKVQTAISSLKTDFGFGDKGTGSVGFGVAGGALNLVLNLLEKNTFSNITLCIDDFERKSDELGCVEVIGYASILSERHGCNIVLLMDDTKIKDDEKIEYERYKEKFVDHEFSFDVCQDDVVNEILSCLSPTQRKSALEAISAACENNLRVITRSTELVVNINEIVQQEFGEEERGYISFHVFALVSMYHALGPDGLENMSTLSLKQYKGEEAQPSDLVGAYRSRLGSAISKYIALDFWLWRYITGLAVDGDGLTPILRDFRDSKMERTYSSNVFEALDRYTYDLSMTAQQIEEDIISLLKAAPRNIIGIVRYSNFRYLIDSMISITGNFEYWKKFETQQAVDFVKQFFQSHTSLDVYSKTVEHSEIGLLCREYTEAKVEHDLLFDHLSKAAQTHDEITTTMLSVIHNSGWSHSTVELLNSVTPEFIAHGITESPSFFESLIQFMRWGSSFSEPPFKIFMELSFAALDSLGKEKLGKFRFDRVISLAKRKV